jgi:RimJ/RimL family protein N-acetyltransferase
MEGKHVNIRPLSQKDLDWFTDWNNNPEYKGHFEPHEFFTQEEIERWYNSEKDDEWWVIEDKKGNPMGQLVTGPQGDCYRLGYILHPNFRSKGYTTEAVKLLIDHLFNTKDIIRIQAECSPENKASIRVLEKAGFTYEGLKRKVVLIQGEYLDGAMYSILKYEWNT